MGKERCKGFTFSLGHQDHIRAFIIYGFRRVFFRGRFVNQKMVSVFSLVCVLCVEKVFDFVGRALGLSLLRSAHHPTIIRLRLNKVKVIIGLFFYIIIFIIAINSLTFRLFDNNVLYSN